jgi:hypothetical protein
MNLVFCDFETRYCSKTYTLKRMSTQAYIRDPRFKSFGVGLAINKNPAIWVTGADQERYLQKVIPGNVVVGHNISGFDGAILNWVYGLKPLLFIDTLAMSRALIGERLRSHSLDSVSNFLFGFGKLPYLKEMDGVQNPNEQQLALLGQYCALDPHSDINLTRNIFYHLWPHFPRSELAVQDFVARCYTEPCLLLDPVLLKTYHAEVVAKRLRSLDDAGVANATELRSNPQFAQALINLGVYPPTKISATTGKPAYAFAKTDEGLMALQEHPDERVQALVAARLENKSTLAESRAENFLEAHKFGPLPVGYLYSGAQTTHRLSGGGGSNNLQNLPRGGALRRAIMAPIRHTLVVGDLAQIELRVTLALALEVYNDLGEELTALNLLAAGGDLYGHFGSIIYQKPVNKEDTPLERQVAKSAVLGLGFGMGAPKFMAYCKQQGIAVDEDFAQYVVKLYRGTYQGVVRLWKYMNDEMREFVFNGVAKQLFKEPDVWVKHTALYGDPSVGLRDKLQIKYPGLKYDAEERQFVYQRATAPTKIFAGKYVENLVQYLARQIIVEQTVKVSKRYKVAMSTHDELVAVVPQEEKEEGMAFVKAVMEAPLEWWKSLPLNADVKSNDRYGNAK